MRSSKTLRLQLKRSLIHRQSLKQTFTFSKEKRKFQSDVFLRIIYIKDWFIYSNRFFPIKNCFNLCHFFVSEAETCQMCRQFGQSSAPQAPNKYILKCLYENSSLHFLIKMFFIQSKRFSPNWKKNWKRIFSFALDQLQFIQAKKKYYDYM